MNDHIYIVDGNSTVSTLWQKLSKEGKGFTVLTPFEEIETQDETNFLIMINNGDKLIRFKEFLMSIDATQNQKSIFRFYRNPIVSDNGTPLDISKVQPFNGNTSTISVYYKPAITDKGSLIQIFCLDFKSLYRDQDLGRYLVPGSSVLVTVEASSNNIKHCLVIVWAEENLN